MQIETVKKKRLSPRVREKKKEKQGRINRVFLSGEVVE